MFKPDESCCCSCHQTDHPHEATCCDKCPVCYSFVREEVYWEHVNECETMIRRSNEKKERLKPKLVSMPGTKRPERQGSHGNKAQRFGARR